MPESTPSEKSNRELHEAKAERPKTDRPKGLIGQTGRSPISKVKYSKEERERESKLIIGE